MSFSQYETIFTRRSVRKYDPAPLSVAELAELQAAMDDVKQIPGQSARFEIVSADKLKGAPSPHAVLAHSAQEDAALCNIGYAMQTLDLFLQSKGYGSVWMGMAKPVSPAPDYRILLAFGRTDAPMRKESGFKRKPILAVSSEDNPIARAARLAPSAVNFQPWKLAFAPGKVTVHYAPKGIGKLLASQLQKIDLGICAKHVELALEHEGKTVTGVAASGAGKDFAVLITYTEGGQAS